MGIHKELFIANCERIAEEEWGEMFYALPVDTRDAIAKRAMSCANEQLLDTADMVKKLEREHGKG